MKDEAADSLHVKTFGNFSVTWNRMQVIGGEKGRESQMVYLLQFLLHNSREGVSKSQLEEILFGDRELSDIRHAMRTVLYNTKKKLRESGLPDVDYIRQEKGIYYWTKELPVTEDARQFEDCYKHAEDAADPEQKLEFLLSACRIYQGEFLPRQTAALWAAREGRRYQAMFFSCVEEAAAMLKEKEDWAGMRELGVHASRVSPFADWEVVTMEALVQMGQVSAAKKLYDDTVDYYMREQGVRPSKKLLTAMGAQINRSYAILDVIQSELAEKREKKGGYLCSYPVFQGIYQMMERTVERSGQSVYLMLCTLVDSKGNPMEKGTMMDELSPRMEKAICCSVRHGDVVSRYSKGQYVVLLVNTTRENCSVVQRRINHHFVVGRQRTGIQYYVNSVICPVEE